MKLCPILVTFAAKFPVQYYIGNVLHVRLFAIVIKNVKKDIGVNIKYFVTHCKLSGKIPNKKKTITISLATSHQHRFLALLNW